MMKSSQAQRCASGPPHHDANPSREGAPLPLVVGLTGGICSGKSTIARFLEGAGVAVVDADKLSRQVVESGSPVLERIAEEFGHRHLNPDGSLDRRSLAGHVFHNPDALRKLEEITHPAIHEAAQRRFHRLYHRDGHPLVVYEASLLVEQKLYHGMAALVAVSMDQEKRLRTLTRERGMDREDGLARMAAQLPDQARTAIADYVIDTSGSLEESRIRTLDVWVRLSLRLLGQVYPASLADWSGRLRAGMPGRR